MNLARLDLNLLVVFDAVMDERSVTRAGRRIGLSQSAVSNALGRLRHAMGDELFVRGPDGMRPTPRAHDLAGPVREALAALGAALEPPVFDPATARRRAAIGMSDYAAALLLPTLAHRLGVEAPHIDLRLYQNTNVNAPALLDTGEIEAAIGAFPDRSDRFGRQVLFDEDFLCVVRRGHPLAARPEGPSLQEYADSRHLLITLTGDASGLVDAVLNPLGLTRRIAMTCNQFLVAPLIVAQSDLVVTLARRMAAPLCAREDMVVLPLPVRIPPFSVTLLWHERLANHPAQRWLRRVISEICAGI